jgi:hypothetical protein
MKAPQVIGIILVVISLLIGYVGINKVADSTKEINLLGLKIDASNESGQQQGYLYLGLAVVLLGGGLYAMKSKD